MVAQPTLYPRTYVPKELDVSDFSQLEPLFNELQNRAIGSSEALVRWLADFSELSSVIDEFGSRRYIDKSCHTDDQAIEAKYLQFVEKIDPLCKPLVFALQKKLLNSPYRAELKDARYQVLLRQWQADVDLYRDENVPLETEVTKIANEYDKICGAMMIEFRGQEYTPQQLARFSEEPDRTTRQEAWESGVRKRLAQRDAIDGLFDQIVAVRDKIARNAGKPDFRAYMWQALKRFDYTPDDSIRFAESIEKTVVPLVQEMNKQRASDLGLATLRPWDLSVDPKNRPPLRPFDQNDVDGFVAKTKSIFDRLSPQLADDFDSLSRNGNLDLASRRGKQPGGYQSTLAECRQAFIFMNAAGMQGDVNTLLHEAGHAFHSLAARDEPLTFLRHAPMEFAEVASMAMELFGGEHLDVFYNAADHARATRMHLENIVSFFPWMAIIDQFQHWIYTHPRHSQKERTDHWLGLLERFFPRIDWSGWENVRESYWQRQLHLFHVPFYYVEYGIAQLGSLQLWLKAKSDPRQALANYRAGLKLGGTRPLPELFSTAGIRFDFSEQTLRPLMDAVWEELATLPR